MLAYCGQMWWKKSENPRKTTDLGQATTTLAQPLAQIQTWTAGMTSERVIHYTIQAVGIVHDAYFAVFCHLLRAYLINQKQDFMLVQSNTCYYFQRMVSYIYARTLMIIILLIMISMML